MPFASINNTKVHYQITGEGPCLLLIHGLGSSTRDWENQIEVFSKTHQVLALDLRGHGQSDKPLDGYSIEQFSQDVAGLLEALGIKQAILVGISLGGWVAFQLALDKPKIVKVLVIVNSSPELVARTFSQKMDLFKRKIIFQCLSMEKIGKVLAPRLFPHQQQQDLRDIFIQRWSENNKPAYMASLKGAIGWSVMQRLTEIKCPCLILSAQHDYVSVEDKKAYVQDLPDAELVVIPDSHHALPFEKPMEFNQALRRFLASTE